MEPNYTSGTVVWISSLFYRFRSPARGDVVVFRAPVTSRFELKRIVALGVQEISWTKGGMMKIDGKPFKEHYARIVDTPGDEFTRISLTRGQFFLLGDNRLHSRDSREYGPIVSSEIIGKVLDS